MPFDYSKLSGKIREKYGTQSSFAKVMGMSERSLSLKISGKRAWTQAEMDKAISCLELDSQDIPDYFFKKKVQNIEHMQAKIG